MADMPDLAKVATALGQLDEMTTDIRTMKLWLARNARIAEQTSTGPGGGSAANFDTADGYRAAIAALVGDGIEVTPEHKNPAGRPFRIAGFGKYATLIVRGPA